MNFSNHDIQTELAAEYERGGLRTSALGALIEDGQILLVRVGDSIFLPGGGQEGSDSLRDAVKREFVEETGLSVDVRNLLLAVEYEPGRTGDGYGRYHKLVLFFRVDYSAQGQEIRSSEVDHVPIWWPLERLQEVRLVPPCADQLLASLNGDKPNHYQI